MHLLFHWLSFPSVLFLVFFYYLSIFVSFIYIYEHLLFYLLSSTVSYISFSKYFLLFIFHVSNNFVKINLFSLSNVFIIGLLFFIYLFSFVYFLICIFCLDLQRADYEDRTVLHRACDEGKEQEHVQNVQHVLNRFQCNVIVYCRKKVLDLHRVDNEGRTVPHSSVHVMRVRNRKFSNCYPE